MAALGPPMPRWIIKHVLVRGYRKAMFRCRRLPEHTNIKTRLSGRTSLHATAAPETIWPILADVTRVGQWSHEGHTATWIDGATHAAVGARFRGTSRSGFAQWSRSCTVQVCASPNQFGYRTEGRLLRDSTEWLWTLEPEAGGTRITQHYRVRSLPVWADRLVWLFTRPITTGARPSSETSRTSRRSPSAKPHPPKPTLGLSEQRGFEQDGDVPAVAGGGPALVDHEVIPNALGGHGPQAAGGAGHVPAQG